MSATESTPDPAPNRASSTKLEQAAVSDASLTAVHFQLLREKPEPTEGFSPIPIFILFVFSALIFSGGIYIGTQSGGFSPMAFDVTRQNVMTTNVAPQPVDMMKLGARSYNTTCIACHQQNGQGVPNAFPPLAGSPYVLGDDARMIKIVSYGLTGPIEVEGKTFNGVMPAHHGPTSAARFSEQKIAAVLTYVRASFGNSAPPVTEDRVKEVLATVGNRTAPWTIEELGGNATE